MMAGRLERSSLGVAALASLMLAGTSLPAPAQAPLLAGCDAAVVDPDDARLCRLTAQAAWSGRVRVGMTFAGGNPVVGTPNTLGMRLAGRPRIGVGLVATGVGVAVPSPAGEGTGEDAFFEPAFRLHLGAGLFGGFSPLPTVGGVGSVDALGTLGLVPLFDDGFRDGALLSWGAGLRLGLLRESFTTPGLSLSAMYQSGGDFGRGDADLETTTTAFGVEGLRSISLRTALGKTLFGFGWTLGAGYDFWESDVDLTFRASDGDVVRVPRPDLADERAVFFLNVERTYIILHFATEVGFQLGQDPIAPDLPAGDFDPRGVAPFGSLALRLTI